MHYMYNIPGQSAHTCCTNSRMPFSCLFLEISLSNLSWKSACPISANRTEC